MADESVRGVIRRYLQAVRDAGLHAQQAVLSGSRACGNAGPWGDIDLVGIAPERKSPSGRRLVTRLWALRAHTAPRIETVPCGEREWETDGVRPILEIARRGGVAIRLTGPGFAASHESDMVTPRTGRP